MQLPQRHEGFKPVGCTKNEITITYDDTFRDYFSLFHTLAFFTELIFFFVSSCLGAFVAILFFNKLSGIKRLDAANNQRGL